LTSLHVAATASINFFTNPHATLCGAITQCELKAAGCTDAYTAANLVIDASTGEVTAKKNVDAGYTDTVCVKCLNAHSLLSLLITGKFYKSQIVKL